MTSHSAAERNCRFPREDADKVRGTRLASPYHLMIIVNLLRTWYFCVCVHLSKLRVTGINFTYAYTTIVTDFIITTGTARCKKKKNYGAP